MPIDLSGTEYRSDAEALLRLQAILLQAVEGARGDELDQEYQQLRKVVLADDTYSDVLPQFVRRYRTLPSLWPALKSFSPQWEPRRVEVYRQFEEALEQAERLEVQARLGTTPAGFDSSAWTGARTPSDRLGAVKTLLPIASNAIEILIGSLEEPGHNGGPLLDETVAAIEALRRLHATLGELLIAADEGNLLKAFNDGLATEAARYARRAARALRNDPMPYAVSAMILSIMTACGVPGIGGYLTGVALNMKKK